MKKYLAYWPYAIICILGFTVGYSTVTSLLHIMQ